MLMLHYCHLGYHTGNEFHRQVSLFSDIELPVYRRVHFVDYESLDASERGSHPWTPHMADLFAQSMVFEFQTGSDEYDQPVMNFLLL